MTSRHVDTLLPIGVVVLLALATALVLFHFLESSAAVQGPWFTLGGAGAGFFVVLWTLRRWHSELNSQWESQISLAQMIAQMAAGNIVRDAGNDINALNTTFSAMHVNLQDRFHSQEREWRDALAKELRREVALQAREQFPELRSWQPKLLDASPVDEVT